MSDKVSFLMEGQEVLSYDRSLTLPDEQGKYLDGMDEKMAQGIVLVDKRIDSPDLQQKSQFVAMNLVNALLNEDDQTAIIMFTYLVNRMPDLKQAKAKTQNTESGQRIGVEFIFDEVKSEGHKIEFQPAKIH